MRICIFGAGVIGGILASACVRAGHEVSIIARGPHLDAIRAYGLTVKTPNETVNAPIPASCEPGDFGPQDLVIVCTKTPALPEVAESIGPLLGPDTQVAFSVNGVFWFYGDGFAPGGMTIDVSRLDPGGLLHRHIGPERALGLVAWSGGEVAEPGIVSARAEGRYVLGAATPANAAAAEQIARDLNLSDVSVEFAPDVRVPMWRKYLSVVASFATSALTGGTIAQVQGNPPTHEIVLALQSEAHAVAQAHGITAVTFDIEKARANPGTTPHKPSMLQDLERGRVMEIDSAYLVLQDLARQAGVATPVLDVVTPLLVLRAQLAGCYKPA